MTTQTPPTTDQLSAAWESVADGFDRLLTPNTIEGGALLVEKVGITGDDRVLDVGAGSGAVALPAARRGARVDAVDVSPTMLQRLTERAAAEGLEHVAGHLMDARHLEFDDDTFTAALSLNGVTMFPEYVRGMAEMVRVTRPGGRIAVATLRPLDTEFIAWVFGTVRAIVPGFELPLDPPPAPIVVADPEVFEQALVDAGVKEVEVGPGEMPVTFDSAQHLWGTFMASNPIAGQTVSGLDESQVAEAQEVLAGMLRERSGGQPGATLTVRLNIGVGTA